METNRLRQFCTLVQTNNLRKASEVSNLSHGAFYKSIKVLEEQLNETLYLQSGRGIVITDFGRHFYLKALEFLKLEEALLAKQQVNSNEIKIGTFEVFSTHLLGSVWKDYFGDNSLSLYEFLPGKLENALLENTIDYGISYEPIPTAGIEFIAIGKIEMAVFAKKNLLQLPFQEMPFVAPISPLEGSPTGIKGLDGWPEDKLKRNVQYRVDMMESGLALARAGKAAIFIPKFVSRFHNQNLKSEYQLANIDLPKGIKKVYRTGYLLKNKSKPENSVERILAKIIRNECCT